MQSHKVPIRTLSYNITHFGKSSTPHTHYLVKKEDRDLFAKLYYQYVFLDKNACCYLERPINNNYQIFPTFEGGRNNSNLLKIDIDFKFIPSKDEIIKNNPIRKYTRENMVTLITYYINLIAKYIEIPKDFRINLLEKENPIIFQSNGNYTKKDGVHIVVESYLIPNSILHTVRNEIVKNNNIIQMFKDIECSNDVDDIIDKCIISTNNWFIYGSGKPDSQTYKVTETYKVKKENDGSLIIKETKSNNDMDLFKNMSNLFASKNIEVLSGVKIEDISENYGNNPYSETNLLSGNETFKAPNETDQNMLQYCIQLMELLSKRRSEKYDDWWKVGQSLYNISYSHLKLFKDFSKKAGSDYNENSCNNIWKKFDKDYKRGKYHHCGINVLKIMAEEDNHEEYIKIHSHHKSIFLLKIIEEFTKPRHNKLFPSVTFAKFTKEYLDRYSGHQLRCIADSSGKNAAWYYYKDHCWHKDQGGVESVDKVLINDYLKGFVDMRNTFGKEYDSLHSKIEYNDNDELITGEQANKLREKQFKQKLCLDSTQNIISWLENNNKLKDIKQNLVKEYNDPKFYQNLNVNPNVFVCKNGVLDLEKGIFREGNPDDMMTNSTTIPYISQDEINNDHYHSNTNMRLHEYLQKQIIDDSLRRYVLEYFSKSLDGNKKQAHLVIFSGPGSNGKTTFVCDLISRVFGDYYRNVPPTILTQKRSDLGSANPEIAKLRGRRLVISEEPDQHGSLSIGIVKELTGGGQLSARDLYEPSITFDIQFQIALLCNDKPNVPSTDYGTTRRLLPIETTTQYVSADDPNYWKLKYPNKYPQYFEANDNIKDELREFAPYMLSLLFEIYKECKETGFCKDKPHVLEVAHKKYMAENNVHAAFKENHIIYSPGKYCDVDESFQVFGAWAKECNHKINRITKDTYIADMNRLLERTTPKKGRWKNWELVAVVEKSNNDSDDDSDDDSDNDSNDNSFEENTESELEEKAGNHNENKEESVRSNTSDIDNDGNDNLNLNLNLNDDINYSIESVNNNDNDKDIIRPIDKNDKNEDKSKKNTKTISKKNTKTKTNSKCEQYDKKIPKGEVAKLIMEKTVKKGGKVKFPKNQEQVEEESESEDD